MLEHFREGLSRQSLLGRGKGMTVEVVTNTRAT
ncbi:hypothetical protein BH09VER1_BH09VER1_56080 [soil metagenome]